MLFVLPFIFVIATSQLASAQKIDFRRMFKPKVDANADQTYELTDKRGPWLILCATFRGQDAARQANDLVYELRKVYRLNAYVYVKNFDISGQLKNIGFSPDKHSVEYRDGKMIPKELEIEALAGKKFQEIAVVVGDFPEMDDSRTQKALNAVKYMKPKSLDVSWNETTSQTMGQLRERVRKVSAEDVAKAKQHLERTGRKDTMQFPDWDKMGPMRQAFVIPNPLLPDEYFESQTIDKKILKYNRDLRLKYSLLKNPKPYSVRVATFRGSSTFQQNKTEKIDDKKTGKKLVIAAAKAHRLTLELRKMNIEAYEFHDRFESYVCVGGFDWVKDETKVDRNGYVQANPEIAAIIKSYGAEVSDLPQMELRNAAQPKSLPKLRSLGILFDVQPIPVAVPRMR